MSKTQGPLVQKTYEDGTVVEVKQAKRRKPSEQEGPAYVMVDTYVLVKAPRIFTQTEQVILGTILAEYRVSAPYALLTQADIGRLTGISRQNVYRAMKKLVEDGWIHRISGRCWQVSPWYGWRGSRSEWTAMRRQTPQPDWRGEQADPDLMDAVDFATGEVR